jgi:hypothetical protein
MQFIGSGQTVVQAVYGSTTTQTSLSSGSYTATGLTATITPFSASNKILVISNTPFIMGTSNSTNNYLALFRNGTTNLVAIRNGININITDVKSFPGFITYLDSPATTSATTYATYSQVTGDASTYIYPIFTFGSGGGGCISSIVLLEISGV